MHAAYWVTMLIFVVSMATKLSQQLALALRCKVINNETWRHLVNPKSAPFWTISPITSLK